MTMLLEVLQCPQVPPKTHCTLVGQGLLCHRGPWGPSRPSTTQGAEATELVSTQNYLVAVPKFPSLPVPGTISPVSLGPWKPSRTLSGCWRLLAQPSCCLWCELLFVKPQSLLSAGRSESPRIICLLGWGGGGRGVVREEHSCFHRQLVVPGEGTECPDGAPLPVPNPTPKTLGPLPWNK